MGQTHANPQDCEESFARVAAALKELHETGRDVPTLIGDGINALRLIGCEKEANTIAEQIHEMSAKLLQRGAPYRPPTKEGRQ